MKMNENHIIVHLWHLWHFLWHLLHYRHLLRHFFSIEVITKKIRTMTLPDEFQDHCNPREQYDYAKLNSGDIVKQVLKGIN